MVLISKPLSQKTTINFKDSNILNYLGLYQHFILKYLNFFIDLILKQIKINIVFYLNSFFKSNTRTDLMSKIILKRVIDWCFYFCYHYFQQKLQHGPMAFFLLLKIQEAKIYKFSLFRMNFKLFRTLSTFYFS